MVVQLIAGFCSKPEFNRLKIRVFLVGKRFFANGRQRKLNGLSWFQKKHTTVNTKFGENKSGGFYIRVGRKISPGINFEGKEQLFFLCNGIRIPEKLQFFSCIILMIALNGCGNGCKRTQKKQNRKQYLFYHSKP